MNDTKTSLAIESHEDKTSTTTGKDYTRFKTNEGWMSCFEPDIIKKLKENEGRTVEVTIAESEQKDKQGNPFKNIRQFHAISEKRLEVKTETISDAVPNRNATMYTSYAKDVFIELSKAETERQLKGTAGENNEYRMIEAINLVKQAKEAFE